MHKLVWAFTVLTLHKGHFLMLRILWQRAFFDWLCPSDVVSNDGINCTMVYALVVMYGTDKLIKGLAVNNRSGYIERKPIRRYIIL